MRPIDLLPPFISRPTRSFRNVVVIGSGINGLCTAAVLAKRGCHVQVLEAHDTLIGGHARTFDADGFHFCAGPQYVWNFGPGEIGDRILRYLQIDDAVPFDAMDADGFERIYLGEQARYDVPMGLDRFREALREQFPAERRGIDRLFGFLRSAGEVADRVNDTGLYMEGGYAQALGVVLDRYRSVDSLRSRFVGVMRSRWTVEQLFDDCGLSRDARAVAFGHGGIFAENTGVLSAIAYAAATAYYHRGARYPRFGFHSLIEGLRSSIEDSGGAVTTGRRVTALERRGSAVERVRCADGSVYECDLVISNASPRATLGMIEGAHRGRAQYQPSNAMLGCFLGVSGYPRAKQELACRNVWLLLDHGDTNYDAPDMLRPPRMLYVASPTTNGPHNRNAGADQQSVIVFAPGSFEQDVQLRRAGPDAYAESRKTMEEGMIDVVERVVFPGLREHLQFHRLLTPLDTHAEIAAEAGNVYGRRLTVDSLWRKPVVLPGIDNLAFASATAGMAGIATGFQTAAVLARRLTGFRV